MFKSIKELTKQYVIQEIDFQEYIDRAVRAAGPRVILSNRLEHSLARELSQSHLSLSPTDLEPMGGVTEGVSLETVVSFLKASFHDSHIIPTQKYSILDAYWGADVVLFLPGKLGIPIQVKPCRLQAYRYRKKVRLQGNCLRVKGRHIGRAEEFVYIEPPLCVYPSKDSLQKLRSSIVSTEYPVKKKAAA